MVDEKKSEACFALPMLGCRYFFFLDFLAVFFAAFFFAAILTHLHPAE